MLNSDKISEGVFCEMTQLAKLLSPFWHAELKPVHVMSEE